MLDGILELLIIEKRGVICHLWSASGPMYRPVPPQTMDDYCPVGEADIAEWITNTVIDLPLVYGALIPRATPDNTAFVSEQVGRWQFFWAVRDDWWEAHHAEWGEMRGRLHLLLSERHDSLSTEEGRRYAETPIAAILSELP